MAPASATLRARPAERGLLLLPALLGAAAAGGGGPPASRERQLPRVAGGPRGEGARPWQARYRRFFPAGAHGGDALDLVVEARGVHGGGVASGDSGEPSDHEVARIHVRSGTAASFVFHASPPGWAGLPPVPRERELNLTVLLGDRRQSVEIFSFDSLHLPPQSELKHEAILQGTGAALSLGTGAAPSLGLARQGGGSLRQRAQARSATFTFRSASKFVVHAAASGPVSGGLVDFIFWGSPDIPDCAGALQGAEAAWCCRNEPKADCPPVAPADEASETSSSATTSTATTATATTASTSVAPTTTTPSTASPTPAATLTESQTTAAPTSPPPPPATGTRPPAATSTKTSTAAATSQTTAAPTPPPPPPPTTTGTRPPPATSTKTSTAVATSQAPAAAPAAAQAARAPAGGASAPRHNCQAGLAVWEMLWSDQKKEWCCEHEQLGCEDCAVNCFVDGVSASCRDRVSWAVGHLFQEEDEASACERAHDLVLSQCPGCSECPLRSACPGAAPEAPPPEPPPDPRPPEPPPDPRPPEPQPPQRRPPDRQPRKPAQRPPQRHSPEPPPPSPERQKRPPTTQRQPRQPPTTQRPPPTTPRPAPVPGHDLPASDGADSYDCGGSEGCEAWTPDQHAWCLTKMGVRCTRRAAPDENGPQLAGWDKASVAAAASTSRPPARHAMDASACRAGAARSYEEKQMCCRHFAQGCRVLFPPYQCRGKEAPKEWSQEKQRWCCVNEGAGCPPGGALAKRLSEAPARRVLGRFALAPRAEGAAARGPRAALGPAGPLAAAGLLAAALALRGLGAVAWARRPGAPGSCAYSALPSASPEDGILGRPC